MDRRKFLKQSCQACLLGVAGIATASSITACSTSNSVLKLTANNSVVSVPVASFANKKTIIVRTEDAEFDVALHETENKTYKAFVLSCTHHENPLNITGSGFICTLHGSQYNLDGQVKKGPASKPLKEYQTRINGDAVEILLNT